MAENKMKEVAKLLGVELNEPFRIKGLGGLYKIREVCLEDPMGYTRYDILINLIAGTYEIEQPILTQKEKAYLEDVLRPFKDRVKYIKKLELLDCEYIYLLISLPGQKRGNASNNLPCFEKDTMYKGMELNKEYTLKELGLFE